MARRTSAAVRLLQCSALPLPSSSQCVRLRRKLSFCACQLTTELAKSEPLHPSRRTTERLHRCACREGPPLLSTQTAWASAHRKIVKLQTVGPPLLDCQTPTAAGRGLLALLESTPTRPHPAIGIAAAPRPLNTRNKQFTTGPVPQERHVLCHPTPADVGSRMSSRAHRWPLRLVPAVVTRGIMITCHPQHVIRGRDCGGGRLPHRAAPRHTGMPPSPPHLCRHQQRAGPIAQGAHAASHCPAADSSCVRMARRAQGHRSSCGPCIGAARRGARPLRRCEASAPRPPASRVPGSLAWARQTPSPHRIVPEPCAPKLKGWAPSAAPSLRPCRRLRAGAVAQ